jgi:hypothetical protein
MLYRGFGSIAVTIRNFMGTCWSQRPGAASDHIGFCHFRTKTVRRAIASTHVLGIYDGFHATPTNSANSAASLSAN